MGGSWPVWSEFGTGGKARVREVASAVAEWVTLVVLYGVCLVGLYVLLRRLRGTDRR